MNAQHTYAHTITAKYTQFVIVGIQCNENVYSVIAMLVTKLCEDVFV